MHVAPSRLPFELAREGYAAQGLHTDLALSLLGLLHTSSLGCGIHPPSFIATIKMAFSAMTAKAISEGSKRWKFNGWIPQPKWVYSATQGISRWNQQPLPEVGTSPT
eukprot:3335853-Amphidinium_carterae.1